jgi:hypothetical protein
MDTSKCRLVSVAQLIAVVALGWQHAMQLPAAWLLQTLAFVSLNKVCGRSAHQILRMSE